MATEPWYHSYILLQHGMSCTGTGAQLSAQITNTRYYEMGELRGIRTTRVIWATPIISAPGDRREDTHSQMLGILGRPGGPGHVFRVSTPNPMKKII